LASTIGIFVRIQPRLNSRRKLTCGIKLENAVTSGGQNAPIIPESIGIVQLSPRRCAAKIGNFNSLFGVLIPTQTTLKIGENTMKTFLFLILTLSILLAGCLTTDTNEQDAPVSDLPMKPVEEQNTPAPAPEQPTEDASIPGEQPQFSPRAGDDALQRGNVYVEYQQLLTLESYPLQFVLEISGNLPDPCHELRVNISEPDENGRIDVALYSLSNPEMMCIQVLQAFDINIPLGSFPAGEYQLYLNGEKVADFQS
jgi:hypothetical protein